MKFDNYTVQELGTHTKRKFNRVFLLENQTDKFIQKVFKKSTPLFFEKLFRQEAAFKFEHASLPKVCDFMETDAELRITLIYKNGIPITDFWKSLAKKQKSPFLISFLNQLIPVFEELNSIGIIHCDIKPSNILIEGTAADFKIHLIDFGLAHLQSSPIDRTTLFALGFSAPELILNHFEILDFRSDLFSVACVMWYLFEGKIPFSNSNPALMTNLQITYPFPPGANIPKNWGKILQKMGAKEPFPTAPNRLSKGEQKEILLKGMAKRFESLSSLEEEIVSIKEEKKWWNSFP